MLNKFQEQDLMSSVEQLENLKDKITDNFGEYSNINKSFDEIIDTVKNIKPSLFSYPKVAKYTTWKFDSTIDISDGEEWAMKDKQKTYTITITQEELNTIKNDINIKSFSGKLEFDDTAMVIGKIIHNQIIKKGGNDERTN